MRDGTSGLRSAAVRRRRISVDTDALLQASRRLDWRFLLPHPELGYVGYVGNTDAELLESLRLFSAATTRIDASAAPGEERLVRPCDVVVVSDPSSQELAAALRRLRPGGSLYLEGHRRLGALTGAPGSARPRCAADYRSILRRLSLVDVRAYWHWPSFARCAEIVPLDDRTALLHALARRRGAGMARLKAGLGRSLVKLDYMERFAPCFSLVGQRAAEGD